MKGLVWNIIFTQVKGIVDKLTHIYLFGTTDLHHPSFTHFDNAIHPLVKEAIFALDRVAVIEDNQREQ